MDYRKVINNIQSSIDDLNKAIRHLREVREKLDKDPNNKQLQKEVRDLEEQIEKGYSSTRTLCRNSIKKYHPDVNENYDENVFNELSNLNSKIREVEKNKNNVSRKVSSIDKRNTKKTNSKKTAVNISNNDNKGKKTNRDDLIPGTNFKKPRARNLYESDQDYVDYLNLYYSKIFRNLLNGKETFLPLSNDKAKDKKTSMVAVDDKDKAIDIYRTKHGLPAVIDEKDNSIVSTNKNKKGGPLAPTGPTDIVGKNPPQKPGQKGGPLAPVGPTDIVNPTPPSNNKNEVNPNSVRSYRTVIAELTDGLNISKKSHRYFASNIKVSKQFKEELNTGNWLYNVVGFLPKVLIKTPAAFVQKMWGKFTLNRQQKADMKTLLERINNMPDSDVDIIIKEYTSNRFIEERFPSAINVALSSKIKEYNNKKVENLNVNITNGYKDLFRIHQQVTALNNLINDPATSAANKNRYINQKNVLLSNTINEIQEVRKDQEDADHLLSSGTHGFEENTKASSTKMSVVGMRFAKNHDLNHQLLEQEANLTDNERLACLNGNAEEALNSFVGLEELLSKNTQIENSFFGKRSVGEKYYSPLANELNYSNDPFVRDLISSIAIAGTVISAANALNTHIKESRDVLNQQQADVAKVNTNNNATMNQVHQTGYNIEGKSNEFAKGMESQAHLDVNNFGMTGERKVLDETGGGIGWNYGTSTYTAADNLQHAATHNLSDTVNNSINNITNQVTSGAINNVQAMNQMSQVVANSQQQFQGLISNYMNTLTQYAQNNPYDLAGVQDALQFVMNNPSSILDMNQAAIDVVNMGQSLTKLSVDQAQALNSLPSDMLTTLVGDAAALTYAGYIESTMKDKCKNGNYGNEVTNLVSGYSNNPGMTI